MKGFYCAVILGVLAWYGYHHAWGFWVFVLVWGAGFASKMSDEEFDRVDRELRNHPSVVDRLMRRGR